MLSLVSLAHGKSSAGPFTQHFRSEFLLQNGHTDISAQLAKFRRLCKTPRFKMVVVGCVQRGCTWHCNSPPHPHPHHEIPIKQPTPVGESKCSSSGASTSPFFAFVSELNPVSFYWLK